jgi:hypothetical protein
MSLPTPLLTNILFSKLLHNRNQGKKSTKNTCTQPWAFFPRAMHNLENILQINQKNKDEGKWLALEMHYLL